MRAAVALFALALAGGCAELGVVTDGSSISYGKPNRGRLIDGVKLPDSGAGYVTPETWKQRGNRYGTNELIDLLKAVGKRMRKKVKDARLVVADLSSTSGGESHAFHRSHQSGRDVDLIYYERDADGKPVEADAMRVFDAKLTARDGSGVTIDVPRTWSLVRELLTAQEAYVQYIFMYRPIAEQLIAYATKTGESETIIARATKALKQPGDSAPHNDHLHVRVYCAPTDRQFGCVDIGPLELLAEREAEARESVEVIANALPHADEPADATAVADVAPHEKTAAEVWAETATTSSASAIIPPSASFSGLVRASSHRIDLRWR